MSLYRDECKAFKGTFCLDMIVEIKVQHCREVFQDSFETYETFIRCIIVQQEWKFNLSNPPMDCLFWWDDFKNRFFKNFQRRR